jgi:hypothetical protein
MARAAWSTLLAKPFRERDLIATADWTICHESRFDREAAGNFAPV